MVPGRVVKLYVEDMLGGGVMSIVGDEVVSEEDCWPLVCELAAEPGVSPGLLPLLVEAGFVAIPEMS